MAPERNSVALRLDLYCSLLIHLYHSLLMPSNFVTSSASNDPIHETHQYQHKNQR